MSEVSTTLTVRMPTKMKERLDRLAKATGRSRSWLAGDAISKYIDLEEWQIAQIKAGIREADAGEFASDKEAEAIFRKWTRAR